MAEPGGIVRARAAQLHSGIELRLGEIDRVETAAEQVHLADGTVLGYDVLVIATGARLAPDQTEGLLEDGWRERVFDFYTLDGASALRDALQRFDGGRLVVNPVELPIKCPVAPLEFCFLADWELRRAACATRSS